MQFDFRLNFYIESYIDTFSKSKPEAPMTWTENTSSALASPITGLYMISLTHEVCQAAVM